MYYHAIKYFSKSTEVDSAKLGMHHNGEENEKYKWGHMLK